MRRNARGVCTIEGCGKPHQAKGLCENHYHQQRNKAVRVIAKVAEARRCEFCDAEIDPTRRVRGPVSFCSRACKDAHQIATGKNAVYALRSYYKRRYGIMIEEAEAMRAKGCAICGTTEWTGRHAQGHIDHCHVSGKVRGVLCTNCNTGLGQFRDDPKLLRRAAAYLKPDGH